MYLSNPYFSHSAKGTTWGKHKYIRKENGRYIYPADLEKKRKGQMSSEYQQETEYNSKKNSYRVGTSSQNTTKEKIYPKFGHGCGPESDNSKVEKKLNRLCKR